MNKVCTGSQCGEWPDTARASDRTSRRAETKRDNTGFRLVHDDSGQVRRGGSWSYDPQYARVADRGSSDPAYRCDFLGFRLCADWRKE